MTREAQIEKIKTWLYGRRDQLRNFMAGELSQLGTDEDHESLDDEEYVVMAESEGKEMAMLNLAIQRLREGTYGLCEECEEEIPTVRLKALPCTTHCIECRRATENVESGRAIDTASATREASRIEATRLTNPTDDSY